ncbi:MAG: Hsp20/alpha crystallin family protein [Burkholderiales bacterium]|nr:Hsp20/alpha crystallin family protein [Burkholderiales bacterium]
MNLEKVRENVESWIGSVAEGWRHLWNSGSTALTRFMPGEKTNLPEKVDDETWMANLGWSVLGGEVFEDENRLVVRIETPGMEKEDIGIEIESDHLVVHGEKRFENEQTQGRWRVMQCAYGSFRRVVPLPVPVRVDEATASYRNGVLRVELPKLNPGKSKSVRIRVE